LVQHGNGIYENGARWWLVEVLNPSEDGFFEERFSWGKQDQAVDALQMARNEANTCRKSVSNHTKLFWKCQT